MKKSTVISLIGRPNVGKSSIFNRLLGKSTKAITHDRPGVTRDRHYALFSLQENLERDVAQGILIDTGGFYPQKLKEDANFFNLMASHAELAVSESDLVLFVVDVREGLLPLDRSICQFLREKKQNFWLILNKYDSSKCEGLEAEFYALGLDTDRVLRVSAAHGLGFSDLKAKIQKYVLRQVEDLQKTQELKHQGVLPQSELVARVAIIGAPNVGKSTLLNRLVGQKRALVSDVAGTTVDPIEGFVDLDFGHKTGKFDQLSQLHIKNLSILEEFEQLSKANEKEETEDEVEGEATVEVKEEAPVHRFRSIQIIDTAGIRKKSHISDSVESQSVYRSLRCIAEADVVLVLVDACKGIGHQDRRLIDIAIEKGKSVLVLLNKYDLKKKDFEGSKEEREWYLDLRALVPWLDFCDIIPFSAKMGSGIGKLKRALVKTLIARKSALPTAELNRFIGDLVERHPLYLGGKGRPFKVRYASLVKRSPPTVLLFSNRSQGIPENYRRYLKNSLQEHFKLANTPVHLIFRTKRDLEKRESRSSTTN